MKIIKVAIKDISLDPGNVNRHPKESVSAIAASLKQFGQQKPIVLRRIGKSLECVAGEGRIRAADSLGWKHISAVVTDLGGESLQAFKIADNQLARLSLWDDAKLAELLRGLPTDLRSVLGFTDRQIEHIVAIQKHVEPTWHAQLREIRIEGVSQEQKDKLTAEITTRLSKSGYQYSAIAY